jgi:hypothetical protein
MIAGRQVDEDVKRRIDGIGTLIDFVNFKSAVVLEAFNHPFSEGPLSSAHDNSDHFVRDLGLR